MIEQWTVLEREGETLLVPSKSIVHIRYKREGRYRVGREMPTYMPKEDGDEGTLAKEKYYVEQKWNYVKTVSGVDLKWREEKKGEEVKDD